VSKLLSASPQREPDLDELPTVAIRRPNPMAAEPSPSARHRRPSPDPVECRPVVTKTQFPTVAGYEIVRELGRGGMGVVYLARELALNRLVALKVVVGGAFAGVEAHERFRREAEAVAALQHPNIVQIFNVGSSAAGMDGGPACPFIALEFADGGTLAAHTGKPMMPRVAAEIVATLADAVEYAHSRGIVHRDLKPGNVLMRVNPQLANPGDGLLNRLTPKVTDFGLAKRVDANGDSIRGDTATVAGTMLGTPEYMAPEQAQGDGDIGRPADVYALGVILYELLTARVPLQGSDALDTLLRVREQEPPLPSRLQARLPRDLDTICSRCLQKDPNRRYASAAALANDLRAWLDGHPIAARPIGYNERLCKWARRRPAVASLLAAVLFVAMTGFFGVLSQWQRAEARALAERHALRRASLALEAAETNLYFGRVGVAQQELNVGNPWDAVRILDACKPGGNERDRRSWEWHYLKNASRGELLSFQAAQEWVWDICYSPDGTMLATAAGSPYDGERDKQPGELRLWDAKTGTLIRSYLGHTGTVRFVRFSPDGRFLCSVSFDKTMRLWDVATGEAIGQPNACMLAGGAMDDGMAEAGPCWFSSDSLTVEYRGPEQWQRLDIASGEVTPLPGRKGTLTRSPDGRFGLCRRGETDFEVTELASGQSCGFVKHSTHASRAALSPDGNSIMLSNYGYLELYDVGLGRRKRTLEGAESWNEALAFSGDGKYMAAAGAGRTIHVWSEQHWHAVAYAGHSAEVRALSFSPNGQHLASCDRTGQVMIWDLSRNPRQRLIQTRMDASGLSAIGLSADGEQVMTVATQWLIRYNRRGQRLPDTQLDGLTRTIAYPRLDITFSPDGQHLVGPLDTEPNVARQWDTSTAQMVREYRGHQYPIQGTAWSSDGRRLAIRTLNRGRRDSKTEVWVWDATTGEKLHEVTTEPIVAMALSSDGSKIGGANRHGQVLLWDVATGRELWRGTAHQPKDYDGRPTIRMFAMAFSPNDQIVATGGFLDGTVQLWKADTGEKLNEPLQGRPTLTGVVLTPDGRRIAAVGYDGEVRMWDVATGQLSLSLVVPTGSRRADIAYSPRPVFSLTNQRLAVLNWNGYIAVWDGSESK
jgi:eukaryotic-like serine/threonine-protein kinase